MAISGAATANYGNPILAHWQRRGSRQFNETTNFVSHHVAGLVIVSYDWSMAWTEMSGLHVHRKMDNEALPYAAKTTAG